MMIPTKTLKGGSEIPVLGLGTWQLKDEDAVKSALDLGYTHIDTAAAYGNHEIIGRAIEDYDREDLWITSKLWRTDLAQEDAIKACNKALSELGTDYLDLYLIHWPNKDVSMRETFKALNRLYEHGKIENVGVSNFTIDHLEQALEVSEVPIVMNQVEFHPFLYQKDLLKFCHSKNIHVTAYSPIAQGKVLDDETLQVIGERHGKTPCQISLRWALQHGLIVIPKSSSREHQKENMEVFDFKLSDEEMKKIDSLNKNMRIIDPGFAEF